MIIVSKVDEKQFPYCLEVNAGKPFKLTEAAAIELYKNLEKLINQESNKELESMEDVAKEHIEKRDIS